jgi:hypothetical protein
MANVRDRLEVSKQKTHRVHMERFNLKKLNEVEGKEQCRVGSVEGSCKHGSELRVP